MFVRNMVNAIMLFLHARRCQETLQSAKGTSNNCEHYSAFSGTVWLYKSLWINLEDFIFLQNTFYGMAPPEAYLFPDNVSK